MLYTIIITGKCNLACTYCYEHIKTNDHLTENMIPKIIDFINRYQQEEIVIDKQHININLNGGEALLYFNTIKKLVRSLKSIGITNFQLSTNLTLAEDDILEYLFNNNFSLHISIDGIERMHNKHRVYINGTGSFQTVYTNIKKIRERYPSWRNSYNITFTPETVRYLFKGFKLLTNLGIRNIHTTYCADYKWDEKALLQFRGELEKIRKEYIKYFIKGEKLYFKLFSDSIRYTIHNRKPSCGVCQDEITIMPNGDIIPCGAFVGQKHPNNYIIGTIKDYVDMNRIKELFFTRGMNVSECKGCELEKRCHVDCYAVNYRVNNDFYDIPDSCCHLNQICLLEAEKIIQYLYHIECPMFISEFK